jgi:hypothetical protein
VPDAQGGRRQVAKAIADRACNALLLKVNQIGSVTESIEAVRCGAGGNGSHAVGNGSQAVRNSSRAADRQKQLARDACPRPVAGDDGAAGGVGRDDQPPLGRDQPRLMPCHFSRVPLPSPSFLRSRILMRRGAACRGMPLRRVRSHCVFGLSLKRRCLGFGRVFVSEIEIPSMLLNLVQSGCVVAQSDNATEPPTLPLTARRDRGHLHRRPRRRPLHRPDQGWPRAAEPFTRRSVYSTVYGETPMK